MHMSLIKKVKSEFIKRLTIFCQFYLNEFEDIKE
jgi:hypothetical protein